MGWAKVVFQGAVGVHGHVEVKLRHKGKERAAVVSVFDGANADTQEPVNIQHLLLHVHTHKHTHTQSKTLLQDQLLREEEKAAARPWSRW